MPRQEIGVSMVFEGYIEIFTEYSPLLLEGIKNTLLLTIVSFTIGFVLGLPTAVTRVYAPRPLRWLAAIYVELIRGTPMIVQLFLVYFALPQLGITLDPLTAAFLGMGINSGAYQAEYFRSAIGAVSRGQWEAALSIGMTKMQTIRYVVLPQALRTVIPAWTNELVYLLKYSSIAYFITVMELVYAGKIIGTRTFKYLEVYVIISIIYLVFAILFMKISRKIEEHVAIPGLSMIKARIM